MCNQVIRHHLQLWWCSPQINCKRNDHHIEWCFSNFSFEASAVVVVATFYCRQLVNRTLEPVRFGWLFDSFVVLKLKLSDRCAANCGFVYNCNLFCIKHLHSPFSIIESTTEMTTDYRNSNAFQTQMWRIFTSFAIELHSNFTFTNQFH